MIIKFISIYLFIGVLLLSFMFVNSFVRGKSSYAKAFGALSLTLQVYLLGIWWKSMPAHFRKCISGIRFSIQEFPFSRRYGWS